MYASVMNISDDNYRICPDYMARTEALTREVSGGEYWSPSKIASARENQYQSTPMNTRQSLSLRGQKVKGKRKVADVGCGYPTKAMTILAPVCESLQLRDQETMNNVISRDFPNLQFQPIDLENPSVPKAEFDVVICADVIEHLLGPGPCLAILVGMLVSDGVLVLSTPERDIMRGENCLTSHKPVHVREWTKAEFADYLQSREIEILDHRLMPKKKLSMVETMLLPFASRFLRNGKWNGCQYVECRARPKD
jgi:SAM-dependent methyltransferase